MELSVGSHKVFGSIADERGMKMASLCGPASETEGLFLEDLKKFGRAESEVTRALDYAKTLDFSKSALRSSYLSHPIRVADFLLRVDPSVDSTALVTAILHNVPETTSVPLADLERSFGKPVSSGVGTLLVDRKVSFSAIQKAYYARLKAAGKEIMLIKLLDKIDNLFVLCLNPDEAVRRDYIAEVREELLPFARGATRGLGDYLEELLEDASRMGFSQGLKDRLSAYQETQRRGVAS